MVMREGVFWLDGLVRQDEKPVSIGPDYLGLADGRLKVLVLVAVKEKLWVRPGDVVAEGSKANVNLVVPVVDQAGGSERECLDGVYGQLRTAF